MMKHKPSKKSRSKGLVSSKKTSKKKQENAEVAFETTIRLRHLLSKKEREEQIILEPIQGTTSVALHPLPPNETELLSPSNALVKQALSPDTVHTTQDVEFAFDRVIPATLDQINFYSVYGQPIAQSAIDPLKYTEKMQRQKHLIVGVGLAGSGKSYTCLGSLPIRKRKHDSDGLVPRVLESLFRQSKHQVCNLQKNCSSSFAVNISIVQVNQRKDSVGECELHDLLQEHSKRSIGRVTAVSFPFGSQSKSSSSGRSSSNGRSSGQKPAGVTSSERNSSYTSIDEPVSVEQDPDTADFFVINGQVRTCTSIEQARETLHAATGANRRHCTNPKRFQSHVLVQVEPVLIHRGKVEKAGHRIAVLDMAALERPASSIRYPMAVRSKDSNPNRSDGHAAIFHCLRALRHNEQIRVNMALARNSRSLPHQRSLKKVPYRQHALTKLLQPLFSAHYSDKTTVSLLMTATPGHTYHAENKILLQEMEGLHRPSMTHGVSTGVLATSPKMSVSPRGRTFSQESASRKNQFNPSDADDEQSLDGVVRPEPCVKVSSQPRPCIPVGIPVVQVVKKKVKVKKRTLEREKSMPNPLSVPVLPVRGNLKRDPSMTYSESTADEEQLPPPIAPFYNQKLRSSLSPADNNKSPVFSRPSAPCEDFDHYRRDILPSCSPPQVPGMRSRLYSASSEKDQSAEAFEVSLGSSPLEVEERQDIDQYEEMQSSIKSGLGEDRSLQSSVSSHSASSNMKFSPMKTLKKGLHASKQKGKRVMGKMEKKMAATTITSPITSSDPQDLADVQRRLKELEDRNACLSLTNAQLQEENDRLRDQNTNLRNDIGKEAVEKSIEKPSRRSFGGEQPTFEKPFEKPSRQSFSGEEQNVENVHFNPEKARGLFDNNPLFQHINQLNRPNSASTWESVPASRAQFSLQFPSSPEY